MLYASMAAYARDERVEVRQPISWSSKGPASVILRPVPLPYLADLLDPDRASGLVGKRQELANQLVIPRTRTPDLIAACS
jgi:5-methylcytosine-specific restriction enzyme subunit McrC